MKEAGFFLELHRSPGGTPGVSMQSVTGKFDGDPGRAVQYLRAASIFGISGSQFGDILDESVGKIDTLAIMTDGDWIWPSDLAYYVEKYRVGVPQEFIDLINSRDGSPPLLSKGDLVRLANEMFGS